MPTLHEMAEEEALRAESEEVEEEELEEEELEEEELEPAPEPEPEPEPEPQALGAIGPDEIRKAERATEAQRRKLAGILGAEYVVHECIFCSALGFVPELPPVGTTLIIVEHEGELTYAAEPPADELPLRVAPDKATCPECDGYGQVLSGSKNPHASVVPCSKCSGNGWIMIARDGPPINAAEVGLSAAPPAPAGVGIDAWGRPEGHQHWGVPPSMIPG